MHSGYFKSKSGRKIVLALLLLVICSLASIYLSFRSTGAILTMNRKLPVYRVKTDEKKVSITFDVSWGDNDYTEKILDILDKHNVKATFFVVGGWIDSHEAEVKKIKDRGHEIGNHSNMHPDFTKISNAKMVNEINATDSKLLKITGQDTKLFRCPEGTYNDDVIETVENTGHMCIQWDVDSIDWKEEGSDIEYNRVMNKVKPGSIILFHNTAKYTPQNLERILEKLKSQGYTFVTVSELIYKNNYYINYSGEQIQR